jgi:hypothetical protein
LAGVRHASFEIAGLKFRENNDSFPARPDFRVYNDATWLTDGYGFVRVRDRRRGSCRDGSEPDGAFGLLVGDGRQGAGRGARRVTLASNHPRQRIGFGLARGAATTLTNLVSSPAALGLGEGPVVRRGRRRDPAQNNGRADAPTERLVFFARDARRAARAPRSARFARPVSPPDFIELREFLELIDIAPERRPSIIPRRVSPRSCSVLNAILNAIRRFRGCI